VISVLPPHCHTEITPSAMNEQISNDFERLVKAAVLKILRETTTPCPNMDIDLNPSNLGTREHWEETYSTELQNYEESNGVDVGEIWFGFESERRITNWITRKGLAKNTAIVDIGCGNGSMLLNLHKLGFTNLFGIDFCQPAVDLASKVAEDKGATSVHYIVADITATEETHKECPDLFHRTFDICIDKGTYDAICLSPENSKEKRLSYVQNLRKILVRNGFFIITSCNWTKDELVAQFKGLDLMDELPTPTMQFGGRAGRTVTALVFKTGTS